MFILEDLWFGNVRPSERSVREGSEYEALSHQSVEKSMELRKLLDKEGKCVFDDYYEKEQMLSSMSETDAFVKGFRLGAKMILDVVGEYHSQLPQIEG